MLHGQRKKDIRHFVNDNVSKDKQGDTSVRSSVRDYIDHAAVECAFSGNNSEGYSIFCPNTCTKSLHNQVIQG